MIAFHFSELHIRDILSWKNCNIKTKKCSNKKCINLRSSGGPKAIYLFGSESFKIVFFWAWSVFRCSTLFFFLMWWCTLGWKSFWKSIHIFHALFWIFLLPIYIPHLAWADFKIKVKQITHSTVHFDWWNPLISKM